MAITDSRSLDSNTEPAHPGSTNERRFISKQKTAIYLIILSSISLIWFWSQPSDEQLGKTVSIESSTSQSEESINITETVATKITLLLTNNQTIKLLSHNQPIGQALFDSPFKTWNNESQLDQQLLLSYKLYSLSAKNNSQTVLRFYLQGKHRGWQGYVVGLTAEALVTQLQQFLVTLQPTTYFTLESDNAALAQLTLLHDEQPGNSLITRQLILVHNQLKNFDIANLLVDNELSTESQPLYQGLLHLLKAKINTNNSNWQRAEKHIAQAQSIFVQLQLAQLKSLTLIESAWIDFVNQAYPESREKLNTAANQARIANEPLLEVKAHLAQSFMAAKTKETALMHSQLDSAKQLIAMHGLNDEHQISVLSNMAWSATSEPEKLSHYLNILSAPFSKLYQQEFYLAAEFLRQTFIEKRQFKNALESIKPWQRISFQTLTHAQVAFARQHWQQAATLANKAYTTARVAHERYDALDAALLLILNQQQLPAHLDINEYQSFISLNATKRWSRINKVQLARLSKQALKNTH